MDSEAVKSMSQPVISVVGSINMDLVVKCAALPERGQTVMALSAAEVSGGKGGNQAVAAAQAGGQVSMIGRVGNDVFAETLVGSLKSFGVGCDFVQRSENSGSGMAIVAVENSGQNSIMVVPGANALVSVEDVRRAREIICNSHVVLLQLEIPMETVVEVIRIAKSADTVIILDPAPVPAVYPEEIFNVDLLCPNQTEAAQLTGRVVNSPDDAAKAGQMLRKRGARNVAITLGEHGTVLISDNGARLIDSFPIVAADSTAAGDAFAGTMAVRWQVNRDLAEAVRFANAAGALCASRPGAQPAMATQEEIESLARKTG